MALQAEGYPTEDTSTGSRAELRDQVILYRTQPSSRRARERAPDEPLRGVTGLAWPVFPHPLFTARLRGHLTASPCEREAPGATQVQARPLPLRSSTCSPPGLNGQVPTMACHSHVWYLHQCLGLPLERLPPSPFPVGLPDTNTHKKRAFSTLKKFNYRRTGLP